MKNLGKILYRTTIYILTILVVYVTYCSIFNIYTSKEELKPFILMIGTIVMISFFVTINKLLKKVPENKSNIIAIILSFLFFIMLAIFGNLITSIPTYDLSNIIKEASIMVSNGGKFVTEDYFSVYHNQVPVTVFIFLIFKIGSFLKFENLKVFAIMINSLFIAITAFFSYLSVKKIKDYKSGILTLLFFMINPIFYLYSSYFYTDTLCMPFAAIAIYVFIVNQKNENIKKSIGLYILMGIILAIGFKIRVVIGILLIAFVLSIIISKNNRKVFSIIICTSFIIGLLLCSFIEKSTKPLLNKELKYPATHWLMMGFNYNTDGRWNINDYNYTKEGKTYFEKSNRNTEAIKQRIQELGPARLISFLKIKLAVNWSNGGYDYLSKLINVEKINPLYEFISGNRKIFITYYYQICKITIMIIFLISLLKEIKNNEGVESKYGYVYISIFGAFLFYLIWEVSTRYSLTFLPWMILVFPIGIECIEKALNYKTFKGEFNDKYSFTINIMKLTKYVSTTILTVSIFLIIVNYYDFTVKKKVFYDKRAIQASWEQEQVIPKIENKIIEQTFKADKSFNHIEIRFKKNKTSEETNYTFILKDENGKKLVKQSFSSNLIENDKYKGFDFKKIKPKGNKKYTIQITSNDANNNNSIGIATYGLEEYDVYPNGNINIDGKTYEADMTFVVHNVVTRTYVSKKVYLFLSFLIILIEIFAFYPFLTYNRSVKEIEGGI